MELVEGGVAFLESVENLELLRLPVDRINLRIDEGNMGVFSTYRSVY